MANCSAGLNAICTEPHSDPIQLPSLGQPYPQWFDDIMLLVVLKILMKDLRPG